MSRSRGIAFALAGALVVLCCTSARADFSDVVAAIEAKGGHQKGMAPLFGLVRMAVWIAHPSGVHDLQLAVWEDQKIALDSRDVEPLLRTRARDYRPMVTTRSRNGEWTFIYARPKGSLVDMLIVTHDHSDTVVVRTVVDPDRLTQEIAKHNHHRDHEDVALSWK